MQQTGRALKLWCHDKDIFLITSLMYKYNQPHYLQAMCNIFKIKLVHTSQIQEKM